MAGSGLLKPFGGYVEGLEGDREEEEDVTARDRREGGLSRADRKEKKK